MFKVRRPSSADGNPRENNKQTKDIKSTRLFYVLSVYRKVNKKNLSRPIKVLWTRVQANQR